MYTKRGLAQFGSAPRSGRGGRGFKSRIPDQFFENYLCVFYDKRYYKHWIIAPMLGKD